MHAQRPRTQGRGTSPRITWTPKGLHHRSKATSQPRHTTDWQARPGFRPRDRSLGAHHARHMGTIPGRASPNCPHMHSQRPRTQGPGTSPRITWTPKGLHHRSKATSQPRHTTGWQARPGFRPRDRCLGAHHARHMGTIPDRASPICPHMHAQRPRTQGRGTSPRITWTP